MFAIRGHTLSMTAAGGGNFYFSILSAIAEAVIGVRPWHALSGFLYKEFFFLFCKGGPVAVVRFIPNEVF